jgi:hypothetical protein
MPALCLTVLAAIKTARDGQAVPTLAVQLNDLGELHRSVVEQTSVDGKSGILYIDEQEGRGAEQ